MVVMQIEKVTVLVSEINMDDISSIYVSFISTLSSYSLKCFVGIF